MKPPVRKATVKEQPRELTAREKAKEFAKNVPKPKVRSESAK